MKSLVEYIKESLIFEGGHSIDGATPIRGDLAKEVADNIMNQVKTEFHIECAALGSVGKKGKNQTSGDIDIAVQMSWEDKDKLISFIKTNIKDCIFGNIVDYLNVFNIICLLFDCPEKNKHEGKIIKKRQRFTPPRS